MTDDTSNPKTRHRRLNDVLAVGIVLGWAALSAASLYGFTDPTVQAVVVGANLLAFYVVIRWAFGGKAFGDAQKAAEETLDGGSED